MTESRCAFPACDCPGDVPACEDYEQTNDHAIEARFLAGTATAEDYRLYTGEDPTR